MKTKILCVFGTRPEAIKMAPLVKLLQLHTEFDTRVCLTAQHRQMLDQVIKLFDIKAEYDLDIMKPGQTLAGISSEVLTRIGPVLDDFAPDMVLVHGDTTTSFSAALAAFYKRIPVGHVEAGLRTGDVYSPWPEEMNRKFTATLSRYHFAPTEKAQENLLKEGISANSVHITGNTVIDALFWVKNKLETSPQLLSAMKAKFNFLRENSKLVLITGHRRENFGEGFEHMCEAIRKLAIDFSDVDFLYPVHLNPNVLEPVQRILKDIPNVHLTEPQDYLPFTYLMMRSHIILTDSGGVQEEAPSLGKPVLVMRNTTERPEALAAGVVKLVGTNRNKIIGHVTELLTNEEEYKSMSNAQNPYGDGLACERILKILKEQSRRIYSDAEL